MKLRSYNNDHEGNFEPGHVQPRRHRSERKRDRLDERHAIRRSMNDSFFEDIDHDNHYTANGEKENNSTYYNPINSFDRNNAITDAMLKAFRKKAN